MSDIFCPCDDGVARQQPWFVNQVTKHAIKLDIVAENRDDAKSVGVMKTYDAASVGKVSTMKIWFSVLEIIDGAEMLYLT